MATLSRRRRDAEDEPDEETPRRSRRSRDEDYDDRDDEPRGRSRRSRSEEEEREENDEPGESRGRRSRRSSREDEPDEEDRPRRSRGRSRDADEDDDRPRRGRGRRSDSEDEDTKPAGRRNRGTGGWGAAKEKRVKGGNFAEEFKPHEVKGYSLIKFVEEEPFDSYNQHWINELDKKSYVCHKDRYFKDWEDGCPLCDIGDKPRSYALLNVIDVTNPRRPELKVWKAATQVADMIERMAESAKTKPINREDLYFEVETTVKTQGKSKKYNTTIVPVKARDLEDDYEVKPLTEDEIADFDDELWTDRSAVTKVETYDELAEIADEIA